LEVIRVFTVQKNMTPGGENEEIEFEKKKDFSMTPRFDENVV